MKCRWLAALLVVLMASSCSTMRSAKKLPLRVGVTPNYPPLIMMQGDKAAGAECDFAAQLSSELGRPLVLMPVPWELQIDELVAGNIDIVMSGMTITPARQARAAFCDSYMDNPLIAVARRGESGKYAAADAVLGATGSMGVLKRTSADAFVRRYCTNAKVLSLSTREDVVFYLANQRIDLYIDDLAAAVGIVSRNEARLELVRIPLAPQALGWAVRPDDEELKKQANEALARWRANGLLDRVLDRWMPYRKTLPALAPAK
jgi:ABC-type amino acid transport substrate-binding protein